MSVHTESDAPRRKKGNLAAPPRRKETSGMKKEYRCSTNGAIRLSDSAARNIADIAYNYREVSAVKILRYIAEEQGNSLGIREALEVARRLMGEFPEVENEREQITVSVIPL